MHSVSLKHYHGTDKYDAIVIGSGIGGLTVAAFLARRGKRVLVLERHYTPGGFTHVFKRREYEWDVGIHYLGDAHDPRTEVSKLFRYISDDKLAFAPMADEYDRLVFPDQQFSLMRGWNRYRDNLKTWFPEEADVIDKYLGRIGEATGKISQRYFAEKAVPSFVSTIAGGWMRKGLLKLAGRTTRSVIEELTHNERLIGVLTGQYGDHGLPPAQSSFAIHSMVVTHYQRGACYPLGGSARIAETITDVISAAGGQVLVRAEVQEVIERNGKAVGVRMLDGQEFQAPVVISDAGFFNTMYKLLPSTYREKVPSMQALGLEPSVGHFCLYIGLNEDSQSLGLNTTNLWVYPGYNHDQSNAAFLKDPDTEFPLTYISFPSAKDPDWARRYPNKATIEIITIAPYEWLEKWTGERWKHRGEEYEGYKERIAQRMLEVLYKHVPQTKGKVAFHELSTPLSTQHFANYQFGELYGLAHTPARFQQRFLRAHTPLKGLYMTGQDLVTCGVAGALYAGVVTASAMVGRSVMGEAKEWVKSRPDPGM